LSLRRGEALQPMELERVRKDGSRIFVSLTASPIKDEVGRIAGISRIARDITQRKQMERALRESEARSRAILDNAVDGIVTINESGQIRSFNRAAERLFGYRAGEVIGRNVSTLMPEPYKGEHDAYMRNYLQTGIPRIIGTGREVVARRKDGTVFPMDLSVSEVLIGEQRLFTGIIHDLTERTTLEKEILEISDAEKRRIGQDLHDGLGQSLTGIGFKTKALETKLAAKGLPESENARQLAELVTQAISQSRAIARGLQPVSVERAGLMAALSELVTNLADLFKIACVFDCPERVLIQETSTAMHLYRIAQEAANNAVKHAHASKINISLRCTDGRVKLAIADDGHGFATGDSKATGTGLHIMRYRAAMIGGTLNVESQPGAGTTVSCVISEHATAKAGSSNAE
jgi:two-component system, LuxR family, sensor kinase FixL